MTRLERALKQELLELLELQLLASHQQMAQDICLVQRESELSKNQATAFRREASVVANHTKCRA